MNEPVNPVGGSRPAGGPGEGQPTEKPDKISVAGEKFFKDMPMTKKQFEQFMRSLTQFISVQIKSEQGEMMKQLRKLGRGGDED